MAHEIYNLESNHFRVCLINCFSSIRIISTIRFIDGYTHQMLTLIWPCLLRGYDRQKKEFYPLYWQCRVNDRKGKQFWYAASINSKEELFSQFHINNTFCSSNINNTDNFDAETFYQHVLPTDDIYKDIAFNPQHRFDYGNNLDRQINDATEYLKCNNNNSNGINEHYIGDQNRWNWKKQHSNVKEDFSTLMKHLWILCKEQCMMQSRKY